MMLLLYIFFWLQRRRDQSLWHWRGSVSRRASNSGDPARETQTAQAFAWLKVLPVASAKAYATAASVPGTASFPRVLHAYACPDRIRKICMGYQMAVSWMNWIMIQVHFIELLRARACIYKLLVLEPLKWDNSCTAQSMLVQSRSEQI